jgi:hypothetical protein
VCSAIESRHSNPAIVITEGNILHPPSG